MGLMDSFRELWNNRQPDEYKSSEPINDGVVIKKAIAMDDLNFWGIVDGHQIMCLIGTELCKPVLLWCFKNGSDYTPSPEGFEYRSCIKRTKNFDLHPKVYIASMELIRFDNPGSSDMWTTLYNVELFPFWDPTYGSGAFAKDHDPHSTKIAIFRAYEINMPTSAIELDGAPIVRTILNADAIDSSALASRRAVIDDSKSLVSGKN